MLRSLLSLLLCLFITVNVFSQRVDETFKPKLITYGYVFDVTPLPDGKAIIAGDFDYMNGVRVGGIARMNTDGGLDATFQTGTGAEAGA